LLSQSPGIALKSLGRWKSDLSERSPALKGLKLDFLYFVKSLKDRRERHLWRLALSRVQILGLSPWKRSENAGNWSWIYGDERPVY